MPSLIPSLGRCITEENFSEIKLNMMYWIEAFKIWTLTQSEEYKEEFSINGKNYCKRQILMRSDTKFPQPFASWSNSL